MPPKKKVAAIVKIAIQAPLKQIAINAGLGNLGVSEVVLALEERRNALPGSRLRNGR